MGTSKSSDAPSYTARALIFSGRPDPTWAVDETLGQRLEALWDALPGAGPAPAAPPLGYRGCFLRHVSGREWFAYGGTVTLTSTGSGIARGDHRRRFEAAILASAPAGCVPASVLEEITSG